MRREHVILAMTFNREEESNLITRYIAHRSRLEKHCSEEATRESQNACIDCVNEAKIGLIKLV